MESDNKKNNPHHHISQQTYYPPEDDFMSLREIIKLIFKHWKTIALFTFAVTVVAATIFLATPRKHGAEAVLQVIMPDSIAGERPDREAHEANIVSYQEYLRSSAIASIVAGRLEREGCNINVSDLFNIVKIERPPKTNLLRIRATAKSEENALKIVSIWRSEYLELLSENSVHRAVLALQSQINTLMNKWIQETGKADTISKHAELTERDKFITLSKAIDEGELWKRIVDGADEKQLKKLSDIHFKSEEMNAEYLMIKGLLISAEQNVGSAHFSMDFYNKVLHAMKAGGYENYLTATDSDPLVASYIKILLDKRDVFSIGEPALINVSRGATKKTAIVFFASLFVACAAAFIYEWLKDSPA